jgi:hypothetical protein
MKAMTHAPPVHAAAPVPSSPLHAVRDVLQSSSGQSLPTDMRAALEMRLSRFFGGGRGRSRSPHALRLGSPADAHEHAADTVATALAYRAPDVRTQSAGRAGDVPVSRCRAIDLSGVRVHTSQRASDSARALGTLAYAVGHDIVFASGQYAPATSRGMHVLMHELVHVAQHASTHESEHTVRRYTEYSRSSQNAKESLGWKHPARGVLRVADDGQMATEFKGTATKGAQRAWTTQTLAASSNATLAGVGSRVRLALKSDGQDITGKAPSGKQDMTLAEIWPQREDGKPVDLTADCGQACKQIMGAAETDVAVVKKPTATNDKNGATTDTKNATVTGDKAAVAKDSTGVGTSGRAAGFFARLGAMFKGTAPGGGQPDEASGQDEQLTARDYHGRTANSPGTLEQWTEELFRKEFGAALTRKQAYAAYQALSVSEQLAFDKKYGINAYAVPHIGQGVAIATEYDMRGYKEPDTPRRWNFHYAAPVLTSGHDYVTMEMFPATKADQWSFFMYGPHSQHQSFSEEQGGTGEFSNKHSAYVVEPQR